MTHIRRAIFFDRDNTLNVDHGYTHKVSDFVFVPRCIEALQLLIPTDYLIIIITNQSGIGRGYYTHKEFSDFMSYMRTELGKEGVRIDGIYHCPHTPAAACFCRKPKPGLFLTAARALNINLAESWAIGDKDDDVLAGSLAGTKTKKIGAPETGSLCAGMSDTAPDLYAAINFILGIK